jgi:hypothetical protein
MFSATVPGYLSKSGQIAMENEAYWVGLRQEERTLGMLMTRVVLPPQLKFTHHSGAHGRRSEPDRAAEPGLFGCVELAPLLTA